MNLDAAQASGMYEMVFVIFSDPVLVSSSYKVLRRKTAQGHKLKYNPLNVVIHFVFFNSFRIRVSPQFLPTTRASPQTTQF
jgi:hypothetical protein